MEIEQLTKIAYPKLTPRAMFEKILEGLEAMENGVKETPDANLNFKLNEYRTSSSDVNNREIYCSCLQATEKEWRAISVLQKSFGDKNFNARLPSRSDTTIITINSNQKGQEYIAIETKLSNEVCVGNRRKFTMGKSWNAKARLIYYGDGMLFAQTGDYKTGRLWPATMKDLFECKAFSQRCVILLILEFFALENHIWKDLAMDFMSKTAYSSIPLVEIWGAHTRAELLQRHYGSSKKRNNKEPIGHGIFLVQAEKIVKPEHMQNLYGYDPGNIYIGRKRNDLVAPLTKYIMTTCPKINEPVPIAHGKKVRITEDFVRDTITMELQLRRKVSIKFNSPRAILELHDDASRTIRSRSLPLVNIPRNSRFKNLKMPPNCVRLQTRKQFLEEGDFQNNCVASYINSVNRDLCSIWSMRKEDGTRNTIEICKRVSTGNPGGYYYIQQMFGFGNSDPSAEDYELVREYISRQM